MSETALVIVAASIASSPAGIAALVSALISWKNSKRLATVDAKVDVATAKVDVATAKVEEVHKATNSMKDQLMDKTASDSFQKGQTADKIEQAAKADPSTP